MGEKTFIGLLAAVFAMTAALTLRSRKRKFAGNILVTVFVIELALLFGFLTFAFPKEAGGAGPASVPRLWVVFLLLTGGYLLFRLFKGKEEPETPAENIGLVMGIIAMTIGYMLLIPKVGYFIATFPFLVILSLLIGYRVLPALLVISGGWLVFVYLVFMKVLHVPIPLGTLFR